MANKRVFYACQGLQIAPVNEAGTVGTYRAPKGVQSVGINSNFNIEKLFQLGQLAVYDQVENNPEVEVTINKIIDGTKPLFMLTMGGDDATTSGSIVSLQNNRCNVKLGIFPDTEAMVSGTAVATVTCTGMYASSINFTFPTDGNCTEEVTLLGTNKTWASGGLSAVFTDSNTNGGFTSPATARRWKFDKANCVFPTGSGGMRITDNAVAPLTNVTVSCDFGREAIYTLGTYEPYYRYINFPVDVNTEIESLAIDGDYLNMNDSVYSCTGGGTSLKDFPIKFVICGGTGTFTGALTVDLGKKNRIQSVNYAGGDAGGGNVTVTYSFQNSSELSVNTEGSFTSVTAVD